MACLRFDYVQNTVSSSKMALTAAGSARRPACDALANGEQWFVVAVGGIVARYGLVSADVDISGPDVTAVQSGLTVTAAADFFLPEHVGRTIVFRSGEACAITDIMSPTQVAVTPAQSVASTDFKIIPAIYHRIGLDYDSEIDGSWMDFGVSGREKELKSYSATLAEPYARPALAQVAENGLTHLVGTLLTLGVENLLPLGPFALKGITFASTEIGKTYYWFKGDAAGLGTSFDLTTGVSGTVLTQTGVFTATTTAYYLDVESLQGTGRQTTSRLYQLSPAPLDFENFFRLGRVNVNTLTGVVSWSNYQAQAGHEFDTTYYNLISGTQDFTVNTHFTLDYVNGLVKLLPAYPLNAPLFLVSIAFTFNCQEIDNAFTVNLYGGDSPGKGVKQLLSKALTNPDTNFFVPTHFLKYLFQDRIVVSGAHNVARLSIRAFDIYQVDSSQVGRKA